MVSVIIPTYNYGGFIAETLDSIRNQSYANFECLIVDDGSTDNTEEAVKPFLADKRFSYSKHSNSGVSYTRNNGLKKAQGDCILFLDADDLVEKDKLKASVDFLEAHADVDLVYTDMRYFKTGDPKQVYYNYACNKNDDNPWMSYVSGSGSKLAAVFLEGNIMVISSPVFRKAILNDIGYFDEKIGHNEDWDFWFRMVLAGKKMHYLDQPDSKTLIRIHKTSASLNVFKMQVGGLLVLHKNTAKIKSMGLQTALEKRIKAHKRAIAETLINTEQSLFKDKIAYLEKMGAYADIFNYSVENILIAKLYLRIFKAGL